MSYQHMDHGGWVENNNAAGNRMYRNRKNYKPQPEKLTPFQSKVMDILGMVCGGIYNAPINWDKVEWNNGRAVFVTLRDGGFSTYDFYRLTSLVFLCHEARIRCEIRAKARGYLELGFWQRSHDGGWSGRHPNLDEAVEAFRAYLPADHSIIYSPPAETSPSGPQGTEAALSATDSPLNPSETNHG